MAKNEARRQKQLAKKKAKREEKRSQIVRATSDDPTIRLASAEKWPIVDALVPEDLWHRGMGHVILARRCPDGRLACAGFLVDSFCLGVKNAFWKILGETEYENLLAKVQESGGALDSVTPEHLAKLIYGAVDYAQSFGLPAHPDYRHARMLLAGIDPSQCPDIFEFGHDGKPYFIQGPYDSPERVRSIMQRLAKGQGTSVIQMTGGEGMDSIAERTKEVPTFEAFVD